jgi:hypothetical protein
MSARLSVPRNARRCQGGLAGRMTATASTASRCCAHARSPPVTPAGADPSRLCQPAPTLLVACARAPCKTREAEVIPGTIWRPSGWGPRTTVACQQSRTAPARRPAGQSDRPRVRLPFAWKAGRMVAARGWLLSLR